jgi:copper chaperone
VTTKTYRIGGMTCDGCVRSVTKAIGRAAPGARVSVDLATGRVTIDGDAPEPAIARAVEAAGFAFEGAA